jgi:hypothetical protein
MEKQQCIPLSTIEVQNVMYCLHFLDCSNILIHFGLKILTIWRFYVAVNKRKACSLKLPFYIYIDSVCTSHRKLWASIKKNIHHLCSNGSIWCYLWRMNRLFMYKISNVNNVINNDLWFVILGNLPRQYKNFQVTKEDY